MNKLVFVIAKIFATQIDVQIKFIAVFCAVTIANVAIICHAYNAETT